MPRRRKYSDEQFIAAINGSQSVLEALTKLGVGATGGNYVTFALFKERLGLSTEHFTGQAYLRGKTHNWTPKRPLVEMLVENSTFASSGNLKHRLIREGILEKRCYKCGIKDWLGKVLVFQLEHKNGNRRDNRLENLELLCPNCHSQTATFCRRKKRACEGNGKPAALKMPAFVGSTPTGHIGD